MRHARQPTIAERDEEPTDLLDDVRVLVEQVFRAEHGRVAAALIRTFRDFDLAEEAMQDAFATALERWPADGVPPNPAA